MKSRKKAASALVGATEFKAGCLRYMQEVHDRKRNSITITKRGKPFVMLVPAPGGARSLHGCMEGLASVQGDLTQPVELEWDAEQGRRLR